MIDDNDEAKAERIRRSARLRMAVFGSLFLAWQFFYFMVAPDREPSLRNVDIVRSIGLLAWALALLVLFAKGGSLAARGRLRDFLDDERALSVRAGSYRVGFWVMIGASFVGYAAAMFSDLRAADLAHLCLSAGVLAVIGGQLFADRG